MIENLQQARWDIEVMEFLMDTIFEYFQLRHFNEPMFAYLIIK